MIRAYSLRSLQFLQAISWNIIWHIVVLYKGGDVDLPINRNEQCPKKLMNF